MKNRSIEDAKKHTYKDSIWSPFISDKVACSKLKSSRSFSLQQKRGADTFQTSLNVTIILAVGTDALLDVCSRIGDNKVLGQDAIPNKGLKLGIKFEPDMSAELFEVCMAAEIFSTLYKRQKELLISTAGKP